jgi:hypothetical protein
VPSIVRLGHIALSESLAAADKHASEGEHSCTDDRIAMFVMDAAGNPRRFPQVDPDIRSLFVCPEFEIQAWTVVSPLAIPTRQIDAVLHPHVERSSRQPAEFEVPVFASCHAGSSRQRSIRKCQQRRARDIRALLSAMDSDDGTADWGTRHGIQYGARDKSV